MERRTAERDFGATSSISKALAVLEYVGGAATRALPEIAAECGLPKSTLLRILGQLVDLGFLRRTEHGRYAVTLKVWRLGCSAVDYDGVREHVIPVLRDLVATSGETAHYAVYEDSSAVYVDKVDGLHPIRSYTVVGGRSPAYASATGKALLSGQADDEVRRVGARAIVSSESTIVGAEPVLAEARVIRSRGYAVNRGEWRAGVWGIGAPVFGRSGEVVAAVGISGPRERIEPTIEASAALVMRAARSLSAQHGAALGSAS